MQKNTLFPSVNYTELKKNSDSYKLFIDYLKLGYSNQSVIIESYLKLLVSENSDMSLLEYQGYVINIRYFVGKQGRGLTFYVSYNSIPVELCTVQKIERGIGKDAYTQYTVEYKGQYFRLEEIGYFEKGFYKTFSDYLFNRENPCIIRIDRTCDFFLKENGNGKKLYLVGPLLLLGETGIRANTETKTIGKGKEFLNLVNPHQEIDKSDCVNRYYGNRKGKRVMLRVYDKLKDLRKETGKGKELLYIDYLKNTKVIRVEFECMQRFCHGYTLKILDQLLDKCDSVFHFNDKQWYGATCYEYKHSENVINLIDKGSDFRLKYFDNFGQHGYTIFENDINPYVVLNDQIIKRTKDQFVSYSKQKILDFLREAFDSIDL